MINTPSIAAAIHLWNCVGPRSERVLNLVHFFLLNAVAYLSVYSEAAGARVTTPVRSFLTDGPGSKDDILGRSLAFCRRI